MNHRCVTALAAIMLLTPPAFADGENAVAGTWTLLSETQLGGLAGEPFGAHPLGQVIFTPDGHFAEILLRSDLPKFQGSNRTAGTPEENTAVIKGSLALFGTYTLTGDKLDLHIVGSTYPNWIGIDQTRSVHLTSDQLTWENPAASGGGTVKLVWQRMK